MRKIIRNTILDNYEIGGNSWKDFSIEECREAFGGEVYFPRFLTDFFQHTN